MNNTAGPLAIETSYAGCRFRSRLEARWAVFFDALGVTWEYEAQGFECACRCNLSGPYTETFPYLPDFWFPELKLHGEVKGSLTGPETRRLLDAAAYLSSNGGGGCHDNGGNDLVVFGPVPPPADNAFSSSDPAPIRLHMHKGDLFAVPWTGEPNRSCCINNDIVAADNGWYARPGDLVGDSGLPCRLPAQDLLVTGITGRSIPGYTIFCTWSRAALNSAYAAARSARFEHGQSGPYRGAR